MEGLHGFSGGLDGINAGRSLKDEYPQKIECVCYEANPHD